MYIQLFFIWKNKIIHGHLKFQLGNSKWCIRKEKLENYKIISIHVYMKAKRFSIRSSLPCTSNLLLSELTPPPPPPLFLKMSCDLPSDWSPAFCRISRHLMMSIPNMSSRLCPGFHRLSCWNQQVNSLIIIWYKHFFSSLKKTPKYVDNHVAYCSLQS